MLCLLSNCFKPTVAGHFLKNSRSIVTSTELTRKCGKEGRRILSTKKTPDDLALDLIYGKKEYKDFTNKEKIIVDAFQEMIDGQDGGLTLPNTKKYQEEREYQELIKRSLTVKE